MAKISMLEASKQFEVSRPTILKHLNEGKITGDKVTVDKNTLWQIDVSELERIYKRRGATPAPAAPSGIANLPPQLTIQQHEEKAKLQADIRVLEAELKAAQAMIAEKDLRIDDLRARLPAPQDPAPRKGWWPF